MPDNELLTKVKAAMCITGNYHDEMLTLHIKECKEYLRSAGVSEEKLNSESVVGIISRGVTDLWYGNGQLSDYFYQRATQLVLESKKEASADV